jgi:hypothetical protein
LGVVVFYGREAEVVASSVAHSVEVVFKTEPHGLWHKRVFTIPMAKATFNITKTEECTTA